MNLTFTQCKQLRDVHNESWRDVVEAMQDQPAFIRYAEHYYNDPSAVDDWFPSDGPLLSFCEIVDIQHHGCASSAYMPAVTYHNAMVVMSHYGDDVLEYIDDHWNGIPTPPAGSGWAAMAVYYLSTAVELWCSEFYLEGVEY